MQRFSRRLTAGALVLAILIALVVPTLAQSDDLPDVGDYPLNTITVTGTGVVRGTPDLATMDIGVETFNVSVTEAFAATNSQVEAVYNALVELGIDPADISTAALNVYATTQYRPDGTEDRGYAVNNTLRVIVRDINQVSAVIDSAVAAGANVLYGPNFDISNRAALESEARQKAMDDARIRAEAYATLSGATLGDVLVITEVQYGQVFPMYATDSAGRGGGGSFVAPGQTDVQIQAQVTYRLVR